MILTLCAGLGAWWVARRFVSYARQIVEHREEAVRANEAKSTLLTNISHELRTPLNAIMGFVGIAADPRCSVEEHADAMGTISSNAEHLLALINDLLDISKAEAGALSIEPTEIDLHKLIDRAVSPLRLRAAEKGIGFVVEGVQDLPRRVLLDRTRVRQVLLNLLSNAVKFTDAGQVTLSVCVESGQLVMRVHDTGPGMAPDELSTLFTPFTQLGSHEKQIQGTGLGLAISRRLVELMDGTIGVESRVGEGSVFTATISLVIVDAHRAAGIAQVQAERLAGARSAIAEDGVDNTRLLSLLLHRAGATTEAFVNGEEARVALLADPDRYQLLITDWDMPVLNGEELVRILRGSGWVGPILSLTAHSMPEQERLCLGVGCDAHMTKPLNASKLIQICEDLIEQHGRRQRAA